MLRSLEGSFLSLGVAKTLALTVWTALIVLGCRGEEDGLGLSKKRPADSTIGGDCEYHKYEGKAGIIAIERITGPDHNTLPSETYKIFFTFQPEEPIEESWVRLEGKQFLLTLDDGRYPGPKFLKRYRIDVEKTFACYLNVITKGACVPITFDFPDIDLTDYSEHEY